LVVVQKDNPDLVVAARRNSPLVVGRGQGENFLASDVSAFIAHTRNAIELGQDQVVEITPNSVKVTDFQGNPVDVVEYEVTWDAAAAEKGGYDLFMLKEIAEQPKAVADTLLGRIDLSGKVSLDDLALDKKFLKNIDKIIITACGTAYHSGLIAKYAIEHWTRIPVEVELASEFRYRDPILTPTSLVVAISQSGETMDTLMAMRYAREQGAKVLAICNTNGSTIPRESDAVIYTHAGPEIAVASTKAFLTQIVALYLFAMYLAQTRGTGYGEAASEIALELASMPNKIDLVLDTAQGVKKIAEEIHNANSILFLGRSVGFPVALEGALKLKELAYMHAEGFAAGELKHGPIALIEDGLPVFVIVPPVEDELHDKIVSNIQEVRARGAKVIVLAEEGDESINEFADHIMRLPKCPSLMQPLLATVPLQIFSCEMATVKGYDVDQPRNLAKSVTVE
jgi:glucosamine--fructose-6-phosphate aminotransferase (isomerizing)